MSLRRESRRRALREQQKVERAAREPEWVLVRRALELDALEGVMIPPEADARRVRWVIWKAGLAHRLEVVKDDDGRELVARRVEL